MNEPIDGPTTDKEHGEATQSQPERQKRAQQALEARKRAFERWCYASGKVVAAIHP